MPTLLYHSAGYKSARKLAKLLGIKRARHSKPPTSEVDTLIRWGSAAKLTFEPSLELNPRSSLVAYKGRVGQMGMLSEAEVPTPPFTTDPFDAAAFGDVMYHGSTDGKNKMSGRGLKVLQAAEVGAVDPTLFVKFLPKHRQFRVHVFKDAANTHTRTREIIHTSELSGEPGSMVFKRNDSVRSTTAIWNFHSGFRYMVVQGKRPLGVIPAAVAAVNALSLDFGAVDIITTADSTPYVLEVNTAPGLGPMTLNWYATRIAERLSLPFTPQETN